MLYFFTTSNKTLDSQIALQEARKTIHEITGIKVRDMTAKVDPNTGNITEYHTAIKLAFGVKH
jgi:flavin-binding protein dodecin